MMNRPSICTHAVAAAMSFNTLTFAADIASQKTPSNETAQTRGYSVLAEYSSVKVDYEFEGGAEDTANYNVFTVGIEKKMANELMIRAGLGKINKLQFDENEDADGDGYQIGASLIKNWSQSATDLDYRTFLTMTHNSATIETEASDTEISTYDISFGGDALMKMSPEVLAFVGMSISPINEGEAKLKANGAGVTARPKTESIDFEKEDTLTMRGGVETQVGKLKIAGEMRLISETSFSLGAKFAF
jgi:hypothetical protein